MRRARTGRAARRIAVVAALGVALPLAGCTTHDGGVDLVRAGCPADIRIDTDALPGVEWGFLYRLLDADDLSLRGGDELSAPLVVDGESTGVRLTVLVDRDPSARREANARLYEHDDVLLAAVDTDRALLDAERYPTVGIFSPLARDSRLIYWDPEVYAGLRNIEQLRGTLAPDGVALAPVAMTPGDPFTSYAIGIGWMSADQVVTDAGLTVDGFAAAGGIRAQSGDALVEPLLFAAAENSPEVSTQLIDDVGYTRDGGVLSARPERLVRYADCLTTLVPLLQRSLADYLDEPGTTNALLVELADRMHHPEFDSAFVTAAFEALTLQRFAGDGRDDTIGDIDIARVRGLFEVAIPAWIDADVAVPGGLEAEDLVTNRFIDPAIGR